MSTTTSTVPALSDSTTVTHIEIIPHEQSHTLKRKPEEGLGKGGCRIHYKTNKMARLPHPELTPSNTNTPALYATTDNDKWAYHGLFTLEDDTNAIFDSDEFSEEYYDCIFIHNVTNGSQRIVYEGEHVKMVTYDAEHRILKIHKDGKVFSFHTATTLFGMTVEEDSESTDSGEEEEDE